MWIFRKILGDRPAKETRGLICQITASATRVDQVLVAAQDRRRRYAGAATHAAAPTVAENRAL